jgi:hypothetical protein
MSATTSSSLAEPENPSVVLRKLVASSPPAAVLELLANGLFPILDALHSEHRSLVSKALAKIQDELDYGKQIRDEINYNRHKKSFDKRVKDLLKDVRRDWKHGYEEQFEMMSTIAEEVLEWLPLLWSTTVEDGQELDLVHRSLVLCTETIDKIANSNSRAKFTDVENQLVIENAQNEPVYTEDYAPVAHSLAWLWRELLVSAEARGAVTVTTAIESDIHRLKIKDEVYGLIRLDERKRNPPSSLKSTQDLMCLQRANITQDTLSGMSIGRRI